MKSNGNIRIAMVLSGAVLLSAGAMANPLPDAEVEIQTQSVKYSQVHAAEPAGAADLHARMRAAARKVCARLWDGQHLPLANAIAERNCVDKAISEAVAAVNIPAVTVVHMQNGKTGKSAVTAVAKR
jgi:UrcA family protein